MTPLQLGVKLPSEIRSYPISFIEGLAIGEVITSASATSSPLLGSGVLTLATAIVGQGVALTVSGGGDGSIYSILLSATTATQTLAIPVELTVSTQP